MTDAFANLISNGSGICDSGVILPTDLEAGTGFSARQFRYGEFAGLMDPLIMVDDYTMTEPTFGAHPHAGLSAVTLLFEESKGELINHDSLDNHLALGAGDLYWVSAGRGVLHDESPEAKDARIRGLQIFIKLPADKAFSQPTSLHVPNAMMPTITAPGTRVRIATGASNGVQGETNIPNPLTLLDGHLEGGARFTHALAAGQAVWIYPVEGELMVEVGDHHYRIQGGRALALRTDTSPCNIQLNAVRNTHFVLMAAPPLGEPFVQKGPFALATMAEIDRARADAEAGHFGQVERKPVTNR